MPQGTTEQPDDGPGRAWLGALLISLILTWLVARGALGRSAQMMWPWGSDSGYFLQRAWQGSHDAFADRTLIWNEDGEGTHGGKHHSPIISLFVPFVALRPTYETLLLVQAGVLGLGVLPLFALCWRVCRDRITALLLLLAAVSVPGLMAIGVGDFRPIAPAVVLVPALVGAAVFGPWPAALAASVLTCATREELAPFLLTMLPLLISERARRKRPEDNARHPWAVPVLAVGLPALLWFFGTSWRAELLNPNATVPGLELEGRSVLSVPGQLLGLLWRDVQGTVVDSPRMVLRQLQVAGLGAALALLRPWALLPMVVMWIGGCLAAGVVNPGQLHYYAPLVGFAAALVPLALGSPEGKQRTARAVAVGLLVGHLAMPWFATPVSVREALWMASQERLPEWRLADGVREDDRVLTSDWLLPTVPPRQAVWLTGDLQDRGGFDPNAYDVALVVPDDPWLPRLQEAGFVIVDSENQGLLLRPDEEP